MTWKDKHVLLSLACWDLVAEAPYKPSRRLLATKDVPMCMWGYCRPGSQADDLQVIE